MEATITIDQLAEAAQKVLDIQEGRTPRIRRNPLSPRAPWPTQEPAAPASAAPKPRHTDAELLLARAWASAYDREPANYLRLLLDVLDTPRPVYRRQATEALASGEPAAIAAATTAVQGEIDRRRQELGKLAAAYPLRYAIAA